jgi:hypothetical protein
MKTACAISILGFLASAAAFAPHPSFHRLSSSLTTQRFAAKVDFALLFDCDGVILETEELHRLAYNAAFKAADLTIGGEPVEWSVKYYGEFSVFSGNNIDGTAQHVMNTLQHSMSIKPS